MLFTTVLVRGQAPIQVGKAFRQVVVSQQTAVFNDSLKQWPNTRMPPASVPFRPYTEPSINLGFSNSFFWVRFQIHNPDSIPSELLLEVENPHINKLQLFSQSGQGRVRASQLTGDHFPFGQRPIRHPHFLFPITVAPQQTLTGYLWVDKHGEQVQVPLRLWDKAHFSEKSYTVYLFAGFMLGIIGLYCVLSFLVLLFFRLRLTLYYFLYTMSVWLFLAAHTGLGFMLLWPEATWWTSAARPTTVLLIYGSSVLFVRTFFRIPDHYRWWNRYTQGLLLLLLGLVVIMWSQNPAFGLFKNYWYNPVYYPGEGLLRFLLVLHMTALISLTTVIAIGVFVYRRTRQTEGLWVAVGYLTTLLSGFSITLVHAGYLPDDYITQNFPLVANALDAIILSILLANRFKNIYQDNARISAELASQRQRNAIQLLEGQRIERKRLSQELHDGISLSLANIRLKLSVLAEKLNGQRTEAHQLVEALREVGQDVRQFSHALSPVMLERYGLVDALEELIQDVRDSHPVLTISFQHNALPNDAPQPLVAQTVYQIVQELLNNAIRHAHARQITILLLQTRQNLVVDVSDDGLGYVFDQKKQGIGLQNIAARAQLLNGSFSVTPLPAGMQHHVEIPTTLLPEAIP